MTTALRLLCCVFLLAGLSLCAEAQTISSIFNRPANAESAAQLPPLPQIEFENFTSLVFPAFRPLPQPALLAPPLILADGASAALYQAITKRLGVRYRFFGTDDRGYDCSGFVWRVFQDAGANFERAAARALWNQLPEAVGEETNQFGTLVFFNSLRHVGIVRDTFTFYHASRSQGVILSSFAGYWGSRITGYRRAPISGAQAPPKMGE
jgi:cell wall-associated NlpC family hydrolase